MFNSLGEGCAFGGHAIRKQCAAPEVNDCGYPEKPKKLDEATNLGTIIPRNERQTIDPEMVAKVADAAATSNLQTMINVIDLI
jgi:hypothetical protein